MNEQSLRYRIARRVSAILGVEFGPLMTERPPEAQDEPKGVTDANFIQRMVRSWEETFLLGYSRKTRYEEYEMMDEAEVAAQLDAMVDAALVSDDGAFQGFRLETGAKYRGVLNDLIERTDSISLCRQILRDCLKMGDEFNELVIDDNLNIVRVQSVQCRQMYANVDEHNIVKRGYVEVPTLRGPAERLPAAYHQRNDSGQVVAAWLPWEMRHVKYRESTKKTYSDGSYLEPMRRPWHRLRMLEEGMVVARLVRAYMRLIHYLDETDKTPEEAEKDLNQYMKRMTQKKTSGDNLLRRPLEVDEDLFVTTGYTEDAQGGFQPKLTHIDTIDPSNSGLSQIDDIEYHLRKLFTRVSGEVVGLARDREDLSLQDIASSRLYQYCQQQILERQFLWPMFRLQLILKGYKPTKEEIKVVWPDVVIRSSWRFSDAFFRKAMAWRNHVEMTTVSRKTVAKQELGMSDEEWEAERKEIEDEAKTMPAIPQGSQAAQTTQGNRSA